MVESPKGSTFRLSSIIFAREVGIGCPYPQHHSYHSLLCIHWREREKEREKRPRGRRGETGWEV